MTNTTDLFPIPSSPPSTRIPAHWPGISPDSTAALREVLRDNHTRWHMFFNDRGFHNHSSHRAIANWALGAAGDLIRAGYEEDCKIQRSAYDSPGPITTKNVKDHYGKRDYFQAYLAFYTDVIRERGIAATVEEYIFSKEMNADLSALTRIPILNRFFGGLVHPMIHLGYGLEFCLPGMVAEGLAQAAIHSDSSSALIPDDFFDFEASATKGTTDTLSRFKNLIISQPEPANTKGAGVHAFTVLKRILNDPELAKIEESTEGVLYYAATMNNHKSALIKHMEDWRVDPNNPHDVVRKIEQLSWMNSILFGVGGWSKDKPFNADFFLMHLVTSSIFLPTYVAYLTPASQEHLLRGYLLISLGWWVSRGRPMPDIKGFYESTSPYPLPSGALPTPHEKALHPADPNKATTPNPWLPIVESCVVHRDDHLPKLQRTLAHYARLYGTREAGQADFMGTELPDVGLLDGSLFIRIAGLAAKRMGRVREGEDPPEFWDRDGFFNKH